MQKITIKDTNNAAIK